MLKQQPNWEHNMAPNKSVPTESYIVTPQGMTEKKKPAQHIDVNIPPNVDRSPYEGTHYGANAIAGMAQPAPAPNLLAASTAPVAPVVPGVRKPEDEPRAIGY
jgi:hypothetical protein